MRLVPEVARGVGPRAKGVTRRQVLRWGIAGTSLALIPVSLPGCGDDGEPAASPGTLQPAAFLDEEEQARLRALVEAILPGEENAGPLLAGVDRYILRLLTDVPTPNDAGAIFAGGPFSGRHPFPDFERGAPSDRFPPNDFAVFVPLNRLQLLGWRARILGSAEVPQFDFNAAVLGPVLGLRHQYRAGLQELEELSQNTFGKPFAALDLDERQATIERADPDFIELVTGHILEGLFSAPEYGGNRDAVGWQWIGYDGDSQPLGYALFDRTLDGYRERPEKPTSGPNPDERFAPFPAEIATLLRTLVRLAGSPRFP
ncbi:MAG: hypothetical protein KatS3mg077_0605 [Candidatus Binatia bacterium]|nr:MAG: hypothetical protein KatS3mg077_0605 [Candidatus Binatia bacterium]